MPAIPTHHVFPCLMIIDKHIVTYELTVIHPSLYQVSTGSQIKCLRKISSRTTISTFHRTEPMVFHQFFFAIWQYYKYGIGNLSVWYPTYIDRKNMKQIIMYSTKGFQWITKEAPIMIPVSSVMNIAPIPSFRVVRFYDSPSMILLR